MQASPFIDRAYLTVTLGADNLNFPLDPSHFSSWLRLRRVLSWVNQFINNCQKFRTDREYMELLSSELKNDELQLIIDMHSKQSFRMNGQPFHGGDSYRQTVRL